MPRKRRLISNNGIYHVVIRGANRQVIFEEDKDRKEYLDILCRYQEELDFDIYAYCLMSNHIHLLIRCGEEGPGAIFRHISTKYAVWFNMKYQRTGFLQQGRFYSEPVEDPRYFLTALRYIHQNPLKAGLENGVGESYPWSSFYAYGNPNNTLVNTTVGLKLLNSYERFVEFHQEMAEDECFDIHKIPMRLSDETAKAIIKQECGCETSTEFQDFSKTKRDQAIHVLREKGLSIRQINRLTGVSRGIIEKIK